MRIAIFGRVKFAIYLDKLSILLYTSHGFIAIPFDLVLLRMNNNALCAFCYPDGCLGNASISYDRTTTCFARFVTLMFV